MLPLCPSGGHGLKPVNALSKAGVDRLLKMINEANVAKSGDRSVDFELSDEFFNRAVTLMQGGKLSAGSGLTVGVREHLIEFRREPCPCNFLRV